MNRHTPVAVAKVKCLLKGCPVHPEETAKLYCEDDEMVVCSECCRIGEHIGHSVLPFAEVVSYVRVYSCSYQCLSMCLLIMIDGH